MNEIQLQHGKAIIRGYLTRGAKRAWLSLASQNDKIVPKEVPEEEGERKSVLTPELIKHGYNVQAIYILGMLVTLEYEGKEYLVEDLAIESLEQILSEVDFDILMEACQPFYKLGMGEDDAKKKSSNEQEKHS